MANNTPKPALTPGNHIYLYQVLRDALGAGRQTFLPAVEEALAAAELSACDLGFESTRALLEELDDFIKLTIFKGGRLYATVIAQPAWDEALAAGDAEKKTTGGKSWKRKKADKALRPQRPRRVPRPVEVAADTHKADAAGQETPVSLSDTPHESAPEAPADTLDRTSEMPAEQDVAEQDALTPEPNAEERPEEPLETSDAPEAAPDEPAVPVAAPEPRPAFSLTVTFDPEHADAGETMLTSTPAPSPVELEDVPSPVDGTLGAPASPAPAAPLPGGAADPVRLREELSHAQRRITELERALIDARRAERRSLEEAARARAAAERAEAEAADARAEAETLVHAHISDAPDMAGYPEDLTSELFCPGPRLAELARILPLGADVPDILDAYYHIAIAQGSIELGRGSAAFPVRYTAPHGAAWALVRIRRRAHEGRPATWVLEDVAL